MSPRDAMRCAGWSLRLAAWASMRAMGARVGVASHAAGVHPVEGVWRMAMTYRGGMALVFGEDGGRGAVRMVGVRELVEAGAVVFAVGDRVVWVLSAEKEQR